MISFLRNLCVGCLIVFGAITIYGFIRGDRMRLTKIDKAKGQPFTLVVSMPDANATYEVLRVFACTAEVTETGVYCIEDGWESDSTRLISRPIESIPYLNLPGGTVLFMAAALDQNLKTLASNKLVLMRAW